MIRIFNKKGFTLNHQNSGSGFTLNRNCSGFTIIEILVVVAVIGILSTLIMISYVGSQKRARDTKRTADVSNIKTAMGEYLEDYGEYPQCIFNGTLSNTCGLTSDSLVKFLPYINNISVDPKTSTPYLYMRYTKDRLGKPLRGYQIKILYETEIRSCSWSQDKCFCYDGINVQNTTPCK